ncbi:MAG: hypothetical protein WCD80_05335 [Desulfobaccales bacterium]
MIAPELRDLWTPTGLILGFQVTLFKWRIEREAEVGDKDDITWLVPADYIGILGMLSFVFGVILLPLSGLVSVGVASAAFAFGALFFVGQALGLAGHYQLFNPRKAREFVWFPTQERVVVGITTIISLVYLIVLLRT